MRTKSGDLEFFRNWDDAQLVIKFQIMMAAISVRLAFG